MTDLRHPALIWTKGILFAVLGGLAAALLIAEAPRATVVVLLAITVWACCRAYYFAFYVIEHYVDGDYRFAGLTSFLRYAWARRRARVTG